MAFPVSARTTGELITAAVWNADLKDNLNTLKTSVTDAGSLRWASIATVTSTGADYAHDIATDAVFIPSGDVTVKLASTTSSSTGRMVQVKNLGPGTVTYYPGGGLTIDGATSTTQTLTSGDCLTFFRRSAADWAIV